MLEPARAVGATRRQHRALCLPLWLAAVACGLPACDGPTSLLVELSAPASVRPDALVVAVYAPTKALALDVSVALDPSANPSSDLGQLGRLVVTLPPVEQSVRVVIQGKTGAAISAIGGNAVTVRPGRQTAMAIVLDPAWLDADGDFVPDAIDNCPDVPNADQRNTDGVNSGDACASVDVDLGVELPDLVGADLIGSDFVSVPDLSTPDLVPPPDLGLPRTARLWSLHPRQARAGDAVYLEGRFDASPQVLFPKKDGGLSIATPTVLGANRLKAIVPADAEIGDVSVTTAGERSNGLPFRRLPFAVALGAFYDRYDQVDVARRAPRLLAARSAHRVWSSERWLYVIGGSSSSAPLQSVERARINADGTLGEFEPAPSLTSPREGLMLWECAGYLYAAGGYGASGQLASIERAPINADGTLGAWAAIASVLEAPRAYGDAVVAGANVYVFGGPDARANDSGRAPIAADGSIGNFVTSGTLPSVFINHTALAIGNYVYILGRYGDSIAARAPINGDGTLGTWQTLASTTNANRSGGSYFELGGAVWAAGGDDNTQPIDLGGSTAHGTVERAALTNDGLTGAFAVVSSTLPSPGYLGAPVIVGNYAYLIGGKDASHVETNRVLRATIQESAHGTGGIGPITASGAQLDEARGLFTSVAIGDRVYLIGGHNGDYVPQSSVVSATVQGGVLGSFSSVSVALNHARSGASAAVVGRHLYVFGGDTIGPYEKTIERSAIDEAGNLGSFEVLASNELADGLEGMAALIVDETLFLVGGEGDDTPRYKTSVQSIALSGDDLMGNFATVGVTLPRAASYGSPLVLGNTFYLLNGWAANDPSGPNPAIVADVSTGFGGVALSSSVHNDYIQRPYRIIGDEVVGTGGVYTDGIETASLGANRTIVGDFAGSTRTLLTPRWRHAAMVIDNSLYVFGGTDRTSTPTAAARLVERADLQ